MNLSSVPTPSGGLPEPSAGHSSPCSMKQSGGGPSLGPMMEIREVPGFCNSCVVPDKYWSHHATSMVPNSGRHPSMYPQVFYTPPPQPQQSYSSSGSSVPQTVGSPSTQTIPPPPDWSCPPPPPCQSHGEPYSHFIYHQYPAQDYTNFLNSCYDADSLVLGGTNAPSPAITTQAIAASAAANPYDGINPSTAGGVPNPLSSSMPAVVSKYTHGPIGPYTAAPSSKMYEIEPTPPPHIILPPTLPSSSSSSVSKFIEASAAQSASYRNLKEVEAEAGKSDEETQDVISVDQDEETSSESMGEGSIDINLRCALCQKLVESSSILPQNAPSPQLSKILDNIDDDELDISVCSGDIEIGGIEDEMMQQAAEQQEINAVKISISRLAQLVGIPVARLTDDDNFLHENPPEHQSANLCFKCKKLVGMAESLDKQLSSVLATLRESMSHNVDVNKRHPPSVSVSTQTESVEGEPVDYKENRKNYRVLLVANNSAGQMPSIFRETQNLSGLSSHSEQLTEIHRFLCHECGLIFRCGRNLGKHCRRKHPGESPSQFKKIPCGREDCNVKSWDNAAHKVHLQTHTSEKSFYCENCFKLFATKSNLVAHRNSKVCEKPVSSELVPNSEKSITTQPTPVNDNEQCHQKDEVLVASYRYHCENCGLKFRNEQRFMQHSRKKCSKKDVFECLECGKLFAKKSELRSHEMVHVGTKCFHCNICGLAFSTRGNQRVHQRTHSSEKRFQCDHCHRRFTRKQTLLSHALNKHKAL